MKKMKQLTFVAVIFLVILISFTNGDRISPDDFYQGNDDLILVADNGQSDNNYNADGDSRDKVFFDDILNDDGYNPNIVIARYVYEQMQYSIKKKVNSSQTIRYQDNRLWNLTFINKDNSTFYYNLTDPDSVLLCFTGFVNLERKVVSQKGIDPPLVRYKPLSGQYQIEALLIIAENGTRYPGIHRVTPVVDSAHPDGVQMSILNEVLPKIPERLHLDQPVRYGRFYSVKTLELPGIGRRLQVSTILEKKSTFCRETYPAECPYVPIHGRPIDSLYYIIVEQPIEPDNGPVVLVNLYHPLNWPL